MRKLNKLLSNNITLYFFIKISATVFTLYVFSLFTSLTDIEIYLDMHFPLEGVPLRTKLVHMMATGINYISNPFFTHLIFWQNQQIFIDHQKRKKKHFLLAFFYLFCITQYW